MTRLYPLVSLMEVAMGSKNFYCYSSRMRHFIQAFNIPFVTTGINKNTKTRYWVFVKSSKLDEVIRLYNLVKYHSI